MNLTTKINRIWYQLKHRYFTLNHIVVGVAAVMAIGWAWGSVSVMQRNFDLEKKLDTKERQLKLVDLEVDLAKYQNRYFASNEYKELAAREFLGLANPGEGVMYLPPNSQKVVDESAKAVQATAKQSTSRSNTELWIDFLLGKSQKFADK